MARNIQRVLKVSLILVLSCAGGRSQTQPNIKQEAKGTSCSNIVALAGNATVNCSSLTPAQRKLIESIPSVLNKILVNQLDPEVVMKKLDEILHAVNPNLPAKTYFCNGKWRTVGPSATAALNVDMGGDDAVFQDMIRLVNAMQYADALKICLAQMQSAPEWLTPRLVCAVAYLGQGDKEKARAMLTEYDSRTGPAYDTDGCKQMSDFLHAQLR